MTLRKIAYLEDDAGLCMVVKKCIEKNSNYALRTYVSGVKFFEELEEYQPDLIILDILLPDINGIAILTSLKKNPLFQNVPVIIFTAQVDEEHVKLYQDSGANKIIFKPFNPINLVSFIDLFWELYKKASVTWLLASRIHLLIPPSHLKWFHIS